MSSVRADLFVLLLLGVSSVVCRLINNQREVYQFKFNGLFPASSTQEEVRSVGC